MMHAGDSSIVDRMAMRMWLGCQGYILSANGSNT